MEDQVTMHLFNYPVFKRFAIAEAESTKLVAKFRMNNDTKNECPLKFVPTGSVIEGFSDASSDVDWMVILNSDLSITQHWQRKLFHVVSEAPAHLKVLIPSALEQDFIDYLPSNSLIPELLAKNHDCGVTFLSADRTRKLNQHDFMPEKLWDKVPKFSKDFASDDTNLTSPSYELRSPRFVSVTCDRVPALHFEGWPTEMSEWIDRTPRYWPDPDTIKNVQAKGFCIVPKPSSPEGDIENEWRFSFSEAEAILFETFNDKQERVYYILRTVYVKYLKEKLTKKVISSYNIKTVMFWLLEQKQPTYWLENEVWEIVEEVFRFLHCTLVDGYAPHYFQPKHNLLLNTPKQDIQDTASFLKAMSHELDEVLLRISQNDTLGLIRRSNLLFTHATAELNHAILKLPEAQAYKGFLSHSPQMHAFRQKLCQNSMVSCLDELVKQLKKYPNDQGVINNYLELIWCGHQYVYGTTTEQKKIKFDASKTAQMDPLFVEIDLAKMNKTITVCVQLFMYVLSLNDEGENFFRMIKDVFSPLLKLFPQNLRMISSGEGNFLALLTTFYQVCQIVAKRFKVDNAGATAVTAEEEGVVSVYSELINVLSTCTEAPGCEKRNNDIMSVFDEIFIFLLVGGVHKLLLLLPEHRL